MTRTAALFLGTVAAVAAAHLACDPATEPFFHNDESRHVMTGVFVRDALFDLPKSAADPKGYAVGYFKQYPALGLITWPPFFYAVEGVAMAAAGTSYTTARGVLAGFVLLGGWYFFRLMVRTHGRWPAALGLALFLFAPLVYEHSRRVMLEVPALALVLASVFHFERYLDAARRRDAVLACLFAAFAALTRFDGVVLLPYFLVRLAPGGRLRLLLRRPVLAGVALALALTVPYYLFTLRVYGGGIGRAAGDGTRPEDTSFLDPRNLTFYPACLPDQVGWPVVVAAAVGLIATARRPQTGPYLALAAATYLTFTPLAELEPRHTIYWVPAVAALAAAGAARLGPRLGAVAGVVLVAGTAADALARPAWWVAGYADAAAYTAANAAGDRPVLFDGALAGSFVYQSRRADPGRRLVVLRGDKVFYTTFSDPRADYTELAATDAEVLARLDALDPEFVVVEEPHLYAAPPGAARLRAVLRAHPEVFRPDRTIPLRSNQAARYAGARLVVYRKVVRAAHPPQAAEVPVPALGRSLR